MGLMMRTLCSIVLFAATVFAVSAIPLQEDDSNYINGENGWYVPQSDGSFVWLSKDDAATLLADINELDVRGILSNSVDFYLYTKSNPTAAQKITEDHESIANSNFNSKNPTRFLIHGWGGSHRDSMNTQIRDAWFTHSDQNIIVVDWARGRSFDYATSVVAIPKTGERIANLIDFLHLNFDLSLDNLDVIGHSLGAQVAGFTGKQVQTGQVHIIVGLDPAMPLFSFDKPTGRLADTDAFYVESIQTNGGTLGFLKPIGKGAFYPNGGKLQPGCGTDLTGGCSHGRSVTYYVESIHLNDFPSIKCENYQFAVNKECGSMYGISRMGALTNAYNTEGHFFVPVHAEAPFGMAYEVEPLLS